ncbi:MAG: acyltransferase [Actinomycetales bacterium]|nr:acyltransferase [Actinomycetales bacterium]
MNFARLITEAPSSIRWRLGSLATVLVYRRAFKSLGKGSVIVRPLRLRGTSRIQIGAGCAIYEDAWLESDSESKGSLIIEDNVYLGHGVHLHALSDVLIGEGSMLADGVLVNSGGHQVDKNMEARESGPITIGKNCFIGQRVMVLGGVTIGDGATIGAGAVVTSDIPAGATAVGVPARVISLGDSSKKTSPAQTPKDSGLR